MAKLHKFNCNVGQGREIWEGATIPGGLVAAVKIDDMEDPQFEVEIPGKCRFELVALDNPAEG
jgi:hypothetical protein